VIGLTLLFFSTNQSASATIIKVSMSFFTTGTVQQSGSVQKFEFALSRSKIRGLTGKGLKIGVQVAANDWSAIIGYSPDQGSDAFYLDMSE
jgi:hypothetical protein